MVIFNFRADRVIELSKALEYKEFDHFDRKRWPQTRFVGMMQARAACCVLFSEGCRAARCILLLHRRAWGTQAAAACAPISTAAPPSRLHPAKLQTSQVCSDNVALCVLLPTSAVRRRPEAAHQLPGAPARHLWHLG